MKAILLSMLLLMPAAAFAKSQQLTVTVKGMVCGFCAQGITKKFSAEPAVEKIDVSLEKKTVSIELKPGQDLADARIESLLTESGYNIETIARAEK